MNLIIDRSQYRKNLIHHFFIMILFSSHNFSKHLENLMILCSFKCNAFEDFETNINIMYLITKDVAIEEKKIKIVIFKNSMNESILKLFDVEMIIISMKIIKQQKVKATTNKFNEFSNEANKEDDVNFEKCFL